MKSVGLNVSLSVNFLHFIETISRMNSFIFTLYVMTVMLLSITSVLCGFSPVKTGTTAGGLAKELADLGVYGSKRAIIIRNKANDWLKIWCASRDDNTGEKRLNPGESLSFAFKPLVIGGYTVFWCNLDYKGFWARWDVFGKQTALYAGANKNDKAYVYEVRDDGVYYKGYKIRGLAAGQNKYILWEGYDQNKNPFGSTLNGYVDRGICNNIPNFFEGKVSAVTVCDNSCVTLYSNLHCTGQTSRLQADLRGCTNFWLSFFNDKAKSLTGC